MKCFACPIADEGCITNCMDGYGPLDARIMQLGEAPGGVEDRYGRPFAWEFDAPSGAKLKELNDRFLQGVPVRRTNANRCRPQRNRTPRPKEIKACRPHLAAELKMMPNLEVVMAMGGVAAQSVLGVAGSVSNLRGVVHRDVPFLKDNVGRDVALVVTYHPSYLIRNFNDEELRRAVEQDFKLAAGVLGMAGDDGVNILYLETIDTVTEWLYHCHQMVTRGMTDAITYDTETATLGPFDPPSIHWKKGPCILTKQLAVAEDEGAVIPWDHPEAPWSTTDRLRLVKIMQRFWDACRRDSDCYLNCHGWKHDVLHTLVADGIDLRLMRMSDSMLMHSCLTQTERHALKMLDHIHGLGNYDAPLKAYIASHPECNPDSRKPFVRRGSYGNIPMEILYMYAGLDSVAAHRVRNRLWPEIQKPQVWWPWHVDGKPRMVSLQYEYEHIQCETTRTLLEIELVGHSVDLQYNRQLYAAMELDLRQRIESIRRYSEVAEFERKTLRKFFMPSSDDQVAMFLFDHLKLNDPSEERSVSKDWLPIIAGSGPKVVNEIQEYRKRFSLFSKDVEPMPDRWIAQDGLVHASYSVHITQTKRSQSDGPNMQQRTRDKAFKKQWVPTHTVGNPDNPPARTSPKDIAYWRRMRRLHRGQRNFLVNIDLSQIELRIVAHLSQEPKWIDAYHAGVDLHRYVAADMDDLLLQPDAPTLDQPGRLNKWLVEMVDDLVRQEAKWLDFRLNYGTGAQGFAKELNMSTAYRRQGKTVTEEEAQRKIDHYFGKFPCILKYHEYTTDVTMERGYTPGLYMNWRTFEMPSGDRRSMRRMFGAIRRKAINYPPQNAGWVCLALALNQIRRIIHEFRLASRLINTVHDAAIFSMVPWEIDVLPMFMDIIENHEPEDMPFGRWRLPIVADAEAGYSWGEMKPLAEFLKEEFDYEYRRIDQ